MSRPVLGKNRIEALSDGIYAIAMTLAVLSIDVDTQIPTHESLLGAIPGMVSDLRHYLISFFTLAGFWINQHYLMDRIKRTDTVLNWIVMSNLLFIALIPATTNIIGNFDSVLAVQIFVANIFMISLTIVIEYGYVRQTEHLGASSDLQKHLHYGSVIFPAYSLMIFFLAWPLKDWATLLYVFMPLLRKFHK